MLKAHETFGGTWWWTHRYPGIRSDSDLYTFGYRFKPWASAPIATAEEIPRYMGEVIEENDLARDIRYRHRIVSASWSSAESFWTIDVVRPDTGELVKFTCDFLWMGQGYYRHSEGSTPQSNGMDRFKGVARQLVWEGVLPHRRMLPEKRLLPHRNAPVAPCFRHGRANAFFLN